MWHTHCAGSQKTVSSTNIITTHTSIIIYVHIISKKEIGTTGAAFVSISVNGLNCGVALGFGCQVDINTSHKSTLVEIHTQ